MIKIIPTKQISPLDAEVLKSETTLLAFTDRSKLHLEENIPSSYTYIHEYAWNAFTNHGSNVYKLSGHEAQGIFIGKYYEDKFGTFTIIDEYLEGEGESQRAYVGMSDKSLIDISNKCTNENKLMLIWVHTHPGFGVFYSGTDNNCLKNNFYMPYQIGIVVDILNEQHKGFKIDNGEVIEFDNYSLFKVDTMVLYKPYEIIKEQNNAKNTVNNSENETNDEEINQENSDKNTVNNSENETNNEEKNSENLTNDLKKKIDDKTEADRFKDEILEQIALIKKIGLVILLGVGLVLLLLLILFMIIYSYAD